MSAAPAILLVEDDPRIAAVTRKNLEAAGFRCRVAGDGPAALREVAAQPPDLVVLDVMLPGLDGVEVTRRIRKSSRVPILMLTARDTEADKVLGLEVGADDYLAKPFSPRELLGRIRAVLRRTSQAARPEDAASVRAYRFAGWRLDTMTRDLTDAAGASVSLGGAEYQLLVTLLASAPKLLSRADLMELVRGRELDPFDRSIDVRVSRLRQTLHDDARAPQIIKTVYGQGYLIGVPVERVTE